MAEAVNLFLRQAVAEVALSVSYSLHRCGSARVEVFSFPLKFPARILLCTLPLFQLQLDLQHVSGPVHTRHTSHVTRHTSLSISSTQLTTAQAPRNPAPRSLPPTSGRESARKRRNVQRGGGEVARFKREPILGYKTRPRAAHDA